MYAPDNDDDTWPIRYRQSCDGIAVAAGAVAVVAGSRATMTTESRKNSATTLSRMNFSGYA